MEPSGPTTHLQGLSNNKYPERNQSNSLNCHHLRSILIVSSRLCVGLPRGLFPVSLPVNILKGLLTSCILAIYPAHLNLLDLITINTFKYHVFVPMGRFQLEKKIILI